MSRLRFCLPGLSRRATAPTTSPNTRNPMMAIESALGRGMGRSTSLPSDSSRTAPTRSTYADRAMSDSFLGQALATALSVVLAGTAMVVSRSLPAGPERAGTSDGDLVVGRDVELAELPEGHGHRVAPLPGQADAARLGPLRGDRADERARVPPEPLPGGAGRLRQGAAPVGGGVRRADVPDARTAQEVRRRRTAPARTRGRPALEHRLGPGPAERRRDAARSACPPPSSGWTSSRSARRRRGRDACRPTGPCSTARSRPTRPPA